MILTVCGDKEESRRNFKCGSGAKKSDGLRNPLIPKRKLVKIVRTQKKSMRYLNLSKCSATTVIYKGEAEFILANA